MGLKDYLGKHEKLTVYSFVAILLITNGAILAYQTGYISSSYDSVKVSYEESGDELIVREVFETSVKNNYNVLYRSFNDNICLDGCDLAIEGVSCDIGTPYFSKGGQVLSPEGNVINPSSTVRRKIESNEVGCYSEAGYKGSRDVMRLSYSIPLSRVRLKDYNHAFFSDNHFYIGKMDAEGLSGSETAQFILPNQDVNVNVQTGSISTSGFGLPVMLIFALLFSLIPFMVWKIWGTEKKFVVPEYLHTIPDESREGWQVDVMMNGHGKLSKNGLASILLRLDRKGILQVEEEDSWFKNKLKFWISKKHEENISLKERDLLDILRAFKVSEDEEYIYCEVSKNNTELRKEFSKYVKDDTVKNFSKSVIKPTGRNVLYGIAVVGLISMQLFINNFNLTQGVGSLFLTSSIAILILSIITPATVWSSFKKEGYKEYLEWLGFKKMLDDYAQIKKYLKEDYSMWEEWLVYGTALGVADNVLKAMEDLSILSSDEISRLNTHHALFISFSTSTASAGSGGGMGGGGFGGGGGGGR